jgi:hypothetical protein
MNPRWQQLIWAGLITSGTRAMILDGIRQFPDHIIKVATDAIFSSVRLDLPIHPTTLGSWKSIELYDLFVLGNGVYNSRGSNDSKHPFGISKTRGFDKEGTLKFDWERIREDYRNGKTSLVMKKEFRRFVKAFHEKKMEERCNWIDIELELKLDTNKSKRIENELIYPVPNPTPTVISTPTVIKNLNEPES